ncbi:MAG: SDR family NAD(P)-dependent oxidoreductase [Microbacteriaceae bacterium]
MSDSSFDLSGKVAIVTGASRGLGRAIATAYAHRGAQVVIASRKLDACVEAAEEITSQTGRKAMAIACHVGHWDDCGALVDRALEAFGRVDVLVNNAGSSPLYPSLTAVSEEYFDKLIAVNLKGAFRLCALVGDHMAKAEGGSIINISSISAVAPGPMELPYAAAKAALNAMTLGLARAYAPKVRANVIMPGRFMTDVAKHWSADTLQAIDAAVPLGRAGQPDEIVGAALYLASAASSYTTGALLTVDGGRSITTT